MTYSTKFNDLWHGGMLAALTACMTVGLADVARSATPDATPDATPSIKVSYGDLDLASAQGAQTFHARVTAAARQVCAPDGVDIRNLTVFTVERACMSEAVTKAERAVQGTKVASVAARRDQG
jgi:UrcA family protein